MLLSINAESSQHREVGWHTAPGRTPPGTSVAHTHASPHSLPLLLVGTCPSETAPTPTASEQAMRQEKSPTIIFSPWASFHRGERRVGVLQICLFFLEYHTKVLWSSSPFPPPCFHHLAGEGASSTM